MGNPALILASASPRRVQLLQQIGLAFDQVVSPADEPEPQGADAGTWAETSARVKAKAVDTFLRGGGGPESARREPRWVLGADTVVSCDGQLLGKPKNDEDAQRMLQLLSARSHTVSTGIALVSGDQVHSAHEVTQVTVARLSSAAITAYIASGEPEDKAGAYAIQGRGGRFVERVEGCYYNVVGLPLARLASLLESVGYDLDPPPPHRMSAPG